MTSSFLKICITVFILINCASSVKLFSQDKQLFNLLNKQLQRELVAQKDTINYRGEKFEMVNGYSIKDSILTMPVTNEKGEVIQIVQTNLKILTLEFRKKQSSNDSTYVEKQEIELNKIIAVAKDINIVFETTPSAVKISRKSENGTTDVNYSDLFFLHLSYEKQNEYLADDIIKAFDKLGVSIKKARWCD
ncbi:hypothetical protein [Pedobacter sp. SL55]|uniref:hypothetical protein n=1 Tax=Pedobacter sp. SL55 TaxID=2995161 RepID=UPI00226FE906|nr:hypothetical protein [Pedobacter sp. SL55]WAC40045.1 hypothetical protein OVA16_15875 [Pedobacter sp. SL55]